MVFKSFTNAFKNIFKKGRSMPVAPSSLDDIELEIPEHDYQLFSDYLSFLIRDNFGGKDRTYSMSDGERYIHQFGDWDEENTRKIYNDYKRSKYGNVHTWDRGGYFKSIQDFARNYRPYT